MYATKHLFYGKQIILILGIFIKKNSLCNGVKIKVTISSRIQQKIRKNSRTFFFIYFDSFIYIIQ